ncbi:MAG: hypothetical protein QM753_02395 [Thermomicrobiales bacterium]
MTKHTDTPKAPTLDTLLAKLEPGWTLSRAAETIPATDAPTRTGRPFTIDDLYAYALPGEAVVSRMARRPSPP